MVPQRAAEEFRSVQPWTQERWRSLETVYASLSGHTPTLETLDCQTIKEESLQHPTVPTDKVPILEVTKKRLQNWEQTVDVTDSWLQEGMTEANKEIPREPISKYMIEENAKTIPQEHVTENTLKCRGAQTF